MMDDEEMEKMGEMMDKLIEEAKRRAHELCGKMNKWHEEHPEERLALIKSVSKEMSALVSSMVADDNRIIPVAPSFAGAMSMGVEIGYYIGAYERSRVQSALEVKGEGTEGKESAVIPEAFTDAFDEKNEKGGG